MERELSRLAHGAQEQEQPCRHRHRLQGTVVVDGGLGDVGEVEVADGDAHQDRPQDEAHVGHLVHHEGLVAGVDVLLVLPVEPDQEVAGQADPLPPDDELDQVGRSHQDQHRSGEEGEGGEEPRHPPVTVHVADGVDEHRQPDQADQEVHHDREPVDRPPQLEAQTRADVADDEGDGFTQDPAGHVLDEQDRRPHGVDGQGADGELGPVVPEALAHGDDRQEGHQR